MAELQKIHEIKLDYLLEFYQKSEDKENFFQSSFNLLAGSDHLQQQIIAGKTEEEIRGSWQPGLEQFMMMRKKYLLYPD